MKVSNHNKKSTGVNRNEAFIICSALLQFGGIYGEMCRIDVIGRRGCGDHYRG